MAGLDFRRAADLFLGSEKELAMAIGVSVEELRRFRRSPDTVPATVMARLGRALVERGQGMARVGELLLENMEGHPRRH